MKAKLFVENMKNIKLFGLLSAYVIICAVTIFCFDGTGVPGDSVHHYLFAKYAPQHPELFFNHWAKPLFVLLSSPFAQFGFIGIKVFNVLVSTLTLFFTFKTIKKLNINNSIVGVLMLVFSPLYFVLTFSGLTEPLFALFVIIGIYTLLSDKLFLSCLVISFLPFIRSEGLIIIGVFVLYLLVKRNWKLIPILFFGHLVYMISGYFVHGDFLWVFNKIPYAKLSSTYGDGKLFHFVEQLIYVIGLPIYILFWAGVIGIIWKFINKRISIELQILVFIGFASFFIAHSLFWYLGIFNSMGLKRVLVGVAPLIAIISLIGFNFITEDLFKNKHKIMLVFQGLLVAYVLIFPFTSNPAAIDWKRDMNLSVDQKSAQKTADFVDQKHESNPLFIYAHPYLSEVFNVDHFDPNKRIELTHDNLNNAKPGDVIIWENWFAYIEHGVTKESLDNNDNLDCLYNVNTSDNKRKILYSVYQRK